LGQGKHLAPEALEEMCVDVSEKSRNWIDSQPQTYWLRICTCKTCIGTLECVRCKQMVV
jgi:hypothetical protein